MTVLFKRFSVILGFSVLAILLIAGALVTRRRLGEQVKNHFWVAHTREVLFELEKTDSLLKDAESSQRGFLYTGDPKYLTPYNSALLLVDRQIDSLAQLTADNPEQGANAARLRSLAHDKLAELRSTIILFQAGERDRAKGIVLSDRGLAVMNQVRDLIDRMENLELGLDARRTEEYNQSVRTTIWCVYAGAGVSILGLAILAYLLIHDFNLREASAQEVRAREQWFRVTLTSIGDAVIATDCKGKVTFMNPIAERLTGRAFADAFGADIHEVFPIFNEFTGQKVENPVAKVMEKGHVVGLANHTVLLNAEGRRTPIEDSAAPIFDDSQDLIGVVLVFHDVTNERNIQELMRRSEKLSAAARLSATVAHEINNPLASVCNLIYLAKLAPNLSPETVDHLTMAEQELARVAHITRQTLGFFRESSDPQPIDLADMIDSVLGLYSNKLKLKNIAVEREFRSCSPVLGSQGELRQAVSNLISNAADAVSQNGNIRLRIDCLENGHGEEVQLSVEDDGPGIPSENLNRIFDPFFTTKKDVGTGLGLYVTREIVERHGGTLTVHSGTSDSTRRGACFFLRLPADRDPNARESIAVPAQEEPMPHRQSETDPA